jgi:hypothetical protein
MQMAVPAEDIAAAERHGLTFTVEQKAGRGQRWEDVRADIASPAEAVEHAHGITAWEVAVFTSDGFQYWSSRHPDCFNSDVIHQGKMTTRPLPTFEVMSWRVLLRTPPRKLNLHLQRFSETLGLDITLRQSAPYVADRSLVEALFTTPLNASGIAQATFEALRLCQRLLPEWTIAGPSSYEGDRWEFLGTSCNEAAGIVMMQFWVSNFRTEWSGDGEDRV